jgi:heptosyltransferase II
MQKILVIQTAFIGDVVLSTALLESLHEKFPTAAVDIVVRQGNETLFTKHPFVNEVIIWNKKKQKYIHWLQVLFKIRNTNYDAVVNVQRFAATGLWTAFSNANFKIGFNKNPFSFLFTHAIKHHEIEVGMHEINRNHQLIQVLGEISLCKPKLYPTMEDVEKVKKYQGQPYLCMAPASVWYTKQYPVANWIHFLNALPFEGPIYLLGGPGDRHLGEQILEQVAVNEKKQIINLAGQLGFLASAALQQKAVINYVNDSAPMHFASAVNAPVVAIYCSTIPAFGYGPLSDQRFVVQTAQNLTCRPCGIHGKKACPLQHFNCAHSIQIQQLTAPLLQVLQH